MSYMFEEVAKKKKNMFHYRFGGDRNAIFMCAMLEMKDRFYHKIGRTRYPGFKANETAHPWLSGS